MQTHLINDHSFHLFYSPSNTSSRLPYLGVIIAAHPSVKDHKVGDRVFGANFSYAERIIVNAKNILPIPSNFSFEEAAGLYITYPTSYAALVLRAQLKQGKLDDV